jgi:outer membrane protein assembly factor BamD
MDLKSFPFVRLAAGLLLVFFLGACGTAEIPVPEDPAAITAAAMEDFNRGRYSTALETFKQVRDQFPFSKYSLLAELKSADCQYFLREYVEALVLYEEFESKHPTNEAMPYVLFQMGRCHFQGIDTIDRDPGAAHDAIAVFTRLVRTYPRSSYVVEAKTRIHEARELLAGHELYVGKFYMRVKTWEAAVGRLENLLAQYPDSAAAGKVQPLLEEARARHLASQNEEKESWFKRLLPFF